MPDFATANDRHEHILKNADYFTAVAFMGRGQYDRHERKTQQEAEAVAEALAKQRKKRYMIYAVAGGSDTYIKTIG